MIVVIILIVALVTAGTIDMYLYSQAKYPERTKYFFYPFVGGYLALKKFGRK